MREAVGGIDRLAQALAPLMSWLGLAQAETDIPWSWVLLQLQTLISIYIVILALVVLLRLLRYIGIERLLHRALASSSRLMVLLLGADIVFILGVRLVFAALIVALMARFPRPSSAMPA